MRLRILAVGRLKAGPERELAARYLERATALGRTHGVSRISADEIDECRARHAAGRRAEEGRLIAGKVGGDALIVLDERGRDQTSEAFARLLASSRDAGRDLSFAIGGPDGLDPALIESAAQGLRFGAMTLPHGLVRVLLAEQIYRAITILAGHPYHRGADHRDGR